MSEARAGLPEGSAPTVTLVIPGYNAEATLRPCLEAVLPLVEPGLLERILFVDDGSTDQTPEILAEYGFQEPDSVLPLVRLATSGLGPGGARNVGWRAATTEWVWFIDSDCVAEEGALERLLTEIEDGVVGVGGSYGNMLPESLVASLIHEEIVARHRRMPREVDFLATFNVLYRREALAQIEGFDERLQRAQDAELAYRLRSAGGRLRFVTDSRVGHFHARHLRRYLRAQRWQGYWRMALYAAHPQKLGGDHYSGFVDHVQPPLAAAAVGSGVGAGLLSLLRHFVLGEETPSWLFQLETLGALATAAALLLLALAQIPMTWNLLRHTGETRMLAFAPMSFLRAFARARGLVEGVLAAATGRFAGRGRSG
ncbi:MAG: glycosyltransferase [Acidobacteriota bacterium]